MIRIYAILGPLLVVLALAGVAQQRTQSNDKSKSVPIIAQEQRPPAPDFRLPSRDGGVRTLGQYRGKWLLVNFWATWCPPCREEMPALSAAQEKWKAKGVVVLGVSMDAQGWRKVTPFLAAHPVGYELVLGNPKVARDYGAGKVYPTTVLVDPEGRVVGSVKTALDEPALDRLFRALLSPLSSP